MKRLLLLSLLAFRIPAQTLGVCATPVPSDGEIVLSLALVGNLGELPIGTVVRVLDGQFVVSETMISSRIGRPTTRPDIMFPLPGAGAIGNTVAVITPDGTMTSIVLSDFLSGTEQNDQTLTIFGRFSPIRATTVYIDGHLVSTSDAGLAASGKSLAISLSVANWKGWRRVTVCQDGSCDTALFRVQATLRSNAPPPLRR